MHNGESRRSYVRECSDGVDAQITALLRVFSADVGFPGVGIDERGPRWGILLKEHLLFTTDQG